MKITAQEEYGLRCLLQLARANQGGLSVKEIALREGLSPAYVEKLLHQLGRAGIIHSVRGIKGGYLLNRDPSQISLGMVVRALGRLPTTQEICDRFTGNRSACIHIGECCIRAAWSTLTHAIGTFLDGVYLSDLLGKESQTLRVLGNRMDQIRNRAFVEFHPSGGRVGDSLKREGL